MNQSIESLLGTWSDGPEPIHRSDALRRAVEHGRLARGERLPAERDLAVRLAVGRSTVVTAYDTLRAEGVLENRQGSGTRVRRGSTGMAAAGAAFEPRSSAGWPYRPSGAEEASGSFGAGRLPERTNGAASKAVVASGSPWVRIPHLPLFEVAGHRAQMSRDIVHVLGWGW
jgi:DNA-binding transcriptional MocR family regulator